MASSSYYAGADLIDQGMDLDGRHTHRLVQALGDVFPDFVKRASRDDVLGDTGCRRDPLRCADLKRGLFPTHTAPAVWLSTAFFLDQKDAYKNAKEAAWVEDKLDRMAAFHHIQGAVRLLKEKMAAVKKASSGGLQDPETLPDDQFALVVEFAPGGGDGTKLASSSTSKVRKYPVRNADEVKAACDYYLAWRHDLPYSVRRDFASRVLTKAAEYGAVLDKEKEEALCRAAGKGTCAAGEAARVMLDRVLCSRMPGPGRTGPVQAELLKLAKACCAAPARSRRPETLIKLAEAIDQFDHAVGLTGRRREGKLPLPEDQLFIVTVKSAESVSEKFNVESPTGRVYEKSALESLRVADVRAGLGNDYAEAMTSDGLGLDGEKAAEVIKTMPRPDAELFDRLCKERGVRPWMDTKKAFSRRFSAFEVRELLEERATLRGAR